MNCSIIVCTYNRASSLERTLQKLMHQDYPHDEVEIIVVDNNSNDATKQVVEALSYVSRFKLHYLFEAEQGLSNARNTGIRHANGDIVIFIDDDAYPKEVTWIQKLTSVYQDYTVGAAGGDADPVWPSTGRPDWLHDKLLNYLGILNCRYKRITDLHYPAYPYGVNISFRKSLVDHLGGFDASMGRKGDILRSAEETELCLKVDESGNRVVFVPDAAVYHVIASSRLNIEWFVRRASSQGKSKANLELKKVTAPLLFLKTIRRIAILLGSIIALFILRLLRRNALAMYAKCKIAMSTAYLRAVGSYRF